MQQVLPLPKTNFFSLDEEREQLNQHLLDQLNGNKISWDQFIQDVEDLSPFSRFTTTQNGRTLLHLAVMDNRIDVVEVFKGDSSMKLRRDAFGLCAAELAQFLNRKECLQLLQPSCENAPFSTLPPMDGFEYLPHPIFETKEGLSQVLFQTAKAKQEDKISAEKIWMGIYFDKEIRKGVHPPVAIRFVDDEVGYGVFAEKKISPCTFVGEYTGLVQERSPKQLKDKRHCLRYTVWEGRKNFCIDAERRGNFTRFINHSDRPNLGLQSIYWRGLPRMIFVALKEIREGVQLTFDYGPLFWKEFSKPPKDL